MKPRVFLSHSKQDIAFIEKAASDLRAARIDVWYDEWEIPPGESFRQRIFEEGIPNCDMFFIYLTQSSSESYWVKRELDAAFIRDAQLKGGFLALFVNSDDTRKLLPLDLQALHSPVFNEKLYIRPLTQLISRSWEGALKRKLADHDQQAKVDILQLQKENAELQAKIMRLEATGFADIDRIIAQLKAKKYVTEGEEITLADIFGKLSKSFASGLSNSHFNHRLREMYKFKGNIYSSDILGPLVILGLVKVNPPQGGYEEIHYLSDLGIVVARRLV